MSGPANHRPTRPLEVYPDAEPLPLPPIDPPGGAAAQAAPAEPARKPLEVAVLRFLDPGAMQTEIPLAFPFEWDGREVRSITVRRLATAEVGAVMDAIPVGEEYDVHTFIAAMSGLPAPVLRALIEDDAEEVIAKARPLLPGRW